MAEVSRDAETAANETTAVTVNDVRSVSDAALRSALEFAVGVAAAGQKLRPPLATPAALRALTKRDRLDRAALAAARRAVVADPVFRQRLASVATEELVDEIGRIWLTRATGWDAAIAEVQRRAAKQEADDAAETALRKAERRRLAAEQVAARAVAERLHDQQDRAREQRRLSEAEQRAARAEQDAASLRAQLASLHTDAARWRADLDRARAELIAAHDRADESSRRATDAEAVRDRLLAERAAFTNASAEPSRPDSIAARGEAAERATITPLRQSRQRSERRRPIAIPGGLYGDSVAAGEHLLRVPRVVVIVDGYNVAKLAWPQLDLQQQRERCVDALEDVVRRVGADVRVIFDGADVVGATNERRLIRVQFSPAGVTADDVIRAEVSALPARAPVVVVTNDQAIVRDVRALGANVLASESLLAYSGR